MGGIRGLGRNGLGLNDCRRSKRDVARMISPMIEEEDMNPYGTNTGTKCNGLRPFSICIMVMGSPVSAGTLRVV